jgi:hypothetical protein
LLKDETRGEEIGFTSAVRYSRMVEMQTGAPAPALTRCAYLPIFRYLAMTPQPAPLPFVHPW